MDDGKIFISEFFLPDHHKHGNYLIQRWVHMINRINSYHLSTQLEEVDYVRSEEY